MDRIGAMPEVSDLVLGGGPVDLSTAALNGKWFNLRNCVGVNAVLIAGIGTAGEDPVISLSQAQDAAGTGAKVLNLKHVEYKVGATDIVAASDIWARVAAIDADNQAASYSSAAIDGAENKLVLCAFVLAGDLDGDNNFSHVRLQVADVGINAQLGTIIYVPTGRAHKGKHVFSHLS